MGCLTTGPPGPPRNVSITQSSCLLDTRLHTHRFNMTIPTLTQPQCHHCCYWLVLVSRCHWLHHWQHAGISSGLNACFIRLNQFINTGECHFVFRTPTGVNARSERSFVSLHQSVCVRDASHEAAWSSLLHTCLVVVLRAATLHFKQTSFCGHWRIVSRYCSADDSLSLFLLWGQSGRKAKN